MLSPRARELLNKHSGDGNSLSMVGKTEPKVQYKQAQGSGKQNLLLILNLLCPMKAVLKKYIFSF